MPSPKFSKIPRYKTFRDRISAHSKSPGIKSTDVDFLLGLVGVKDTLTGLFLVVENFRRIASFCRKICSKPQWHFAADIISEAEATSSSLLAIRTKVKITALEAKPEVDRNHTFHGWIESNPLYATIGYLPANREHSKIYLNLVAQILIAHLSTQRDGKSEALTSNFEAALQAARSLSGDECLKYFPENPLQPETYLDQIPKIPGQRQIPAVTNYLSQCLSLRSTHSLKDLAELLSPTPSKAPRRRHSNEIPHFEPLLVMDETDDTSDDGKNAHLSRLFVIPKPSQAFVPQPFFSSIAQGLAKTRSRDNQLLHFSWAALNQQDLEVLLEYLFDINSDDFDRAKTQAQLFLMLAAGLSPARVAALEIAYDLSPSAGAEVYIFRTGMLRLFTTGPEYNTPLDYAAMKQAHPRQTHIELTLPEALRTPLMNYLQHRAPSHFIGNSRLFYDSAEEIRRTCAKALSAIKQQSETRLTLPKIQGHMMREIANLQESDLAASSLVLGKEDHLARTATHYFASDLEILTRFFSRALIKTARTAGIEIDYKESFPTKPDICVGTPIRPRLQAVSALVEKVRTVLEQKTKHIKTLEDLVDYHNTYVFYTTLVVFYSTGFRAVNSPFITEEMYDPATGFSTIRDKSSADGYHARLVWLPPICRQQLKLFGSHLEVIRSLSPCLPHDSDRKENVIFFLTPDGRRERVTRTGIECFLSNFGFHLPPNVQRHFAKSELQEVGCPAEIIEIMLGHWHHGQEPWTQESALFPWDFKTAIEQYLPPLLRRIGIAPVRGLQRPPSKIQLSLHEKTSEEQKFTVRQRQHRLGQKALALLEDQPPGSIWFANLGKTFKDQPAPKAFKRQERITLLKMHALLPELYQGNEKGLCIPTERLQRLLHRLQPRPMQPAAHIKRLNFLIKGLRWGKNELEWQVDIPVAPVTLPKGLNRIRPPLMRKVGTFREIERVFMQDLERALPTSPILRIAQIFFSAVLYGGINELSWARGFIRGLRSDIFQHEEILWIDLWNGPYEGSSAEDKWLAQRNPHVYRRWLADPTTQLLIYRWLKLSPDDREAPQSFNLDTVYEHYRQHMAQIFGFSLPDFESLLNVANARTTLSSPPFISAYAEGKIKSASLPDPAWLRLLTAKTFPATPSLASRTDRRIDNRQNRDHQVQLGLLSDLRNLISHQAANISASRLAKKISDFLERKQDRMSQALVLLTQWAVQLCSDRESPLEQRKKGPEAPSTVYAYLGQFAGEFLEASGELDIIEFGSDELQALFEQVVEKIHGLKITNPENPDKRERDRVEYILERLNQFLGFLHVFYALPQLSFKLKANKVYVLPGETVRANVITPKEFLMLRQRLGWGKSSLTRQEKMVLVVAILAFRTGMRIMEIYGLQIRDIQGSSQIEVLVRNNEFRGLKSRAGKRRLPLYLLMPPEELEFIRAWHGFRATELGATPKCALFASGPLDAAPCPEQELFTPLRQALKEVTGDPTVVPHTLRHSFTTWLLIKLLVQGESGIASLSPFLDSAEFAPDTCSSLRKKLLENETSGRKILYAAAAMLGHADTETLLASYMHLTDWLCWHYSRHPSSIPPLTTKGLAQILGGSESNARKILGADGNLIAKQICQKAESFEKILEPPLLTRAQSCFPETARLSASTDFIPFDQALHRFYNHGHLPHQLRWPRKKVEIYLLQYLYEKIVNLNHQDQKIVLKWSGKYIASYRHYDQAFVLDDPRMANQVLKILDLLDIEYAIRHHHSRWEDDSAQDEALTHWRKKTGAHVGRGHRRCGRNLKKGSLRISLINVKIRGLNMTFEVKISNILSLLFLILNHHSLPSSSPTS